MRCSTVVTSDSMTEPSIFSVVPKLPSSTVAVLKMLSATAVAGASVRVAK
jgi:hypothetical protein